MYHPAEGNQFGILTYPGLIGALTGYSEQKLAVSEKAWGGPAPETRMGNPFPIVLRDVLQYDKNLDDVVKRYSEAHRTCNMELGAGDGKADDFDLF